MGRESGIWIVRHDVVFWIWLSPQCLRVDINDMLWHHEPDPKGGCSMRFICSCVYLFNPVCWCEGNTKLGNWNLHAGLPFQGCNGTSCTTNMRQQTNHRTKHKAHNNEHLQIHDSKSSQQQHISSKTDKPRQPSKIQRNNWASKEEHLDETKQHKANSPTTLRGITASTHTQINNDD